MSRATLRMVLAELTSIQTSDLFIQDSINSCIAMIRQDLYNEVPAQRHSATSREAAAEVAPRVEKLAMRVLQALATQAATDEEGQSLTHMGGNTYRPRRVNLVTLGFVADSGETRRTSSKRAATVWSITDQGRAFLESRHE